MWPIRTDSALCTAGRLTWQPSAYGRAATRRLVQGSRAKASGHAELIFSSDPQPIAEGPIAEGPTTSCPNHDNHLHIRHR
ncbi:hypothetical protein [Streptomyces cinereospinus]|uniref:Uncharacterized protein n=1 Tax=Streptomyces cinereospinus TaxID=285561 RepID=A0ABV5N0P6_9ACTN